MRVTDLALSDFRSYRELVLALEPGVTAFVGPNGQGKTNIVEAVGYLATFSSHRVAADTALVRRGTPGAVVRAKVRDDDRDTLLEVEIIAGRANRARLDRHPARPRDLLGHLRLVVFAPEDLELVRGDPSGRRRYLDDLLVQLRPRLSEVRQRYDRVLRQRVALLKSAGAAARAGRSVDLSTLDVWDAQLAEAGAEIVAARADLVARLRPHVAEAYEQVSGGQGEARIDARTSLVGAEGGPDPDAAVLAGVTGPDTVDDDAARAARDRAAELEAALMEPAAVAERMLAALGEARPREVERGVCLVGPHRDDLALALGPLPARGYASHGESWSYALALRLAAWRVLRDAAAETGGGDPVLVLDDVFAELDSRRRSRLAGMVAEAEQVLLTAAVDEDVPEELAGTRVDVADGTATVRGAA
ncbi:DNA replication/repair protein RecF [Georgenia sp. Z1344]|uniref:DNA replication/repair protein RecF n=1 Tax=Georgenia sp. Z1344 TaxID=3416706 RepID=UPI003CEC6481